MKKIGFLSFGHWNPSPGSQARTAADALLQSIDLAVEAERLGVDGAYFRIHHFAHQLSSPFPLLSAVGAKTKKIEIGTGVIDMRDENPHYMAEDAGTADMIADGRLQLEENLRAVDVHLTEVDLQQIEEATSKVALEGTRLPEATLKMTGI